MTGEFRREIDRLRADFGVMPREVAVAVFAVGSALFFASCLVGWATCGRVCLEPRGG